jgi:hypothetical protein
MTPKLIARLCAITLLSSAALAQDTPSGWQTKDIGNGYRLLIAPSQNPSLQVTVMMAPPEARQGSLASWFDQSAANWAVGMAAKVEELSPIGQQTGYADRLMTMRMQNGRQLTVYFVAYENERQRRVLGVMFTSEIPAKDAQLNEAFRYVQQTARAGLMSVAAPSSSTTVEQKASFGPPNVERAPWLRPGHGIGDAAVKFVLPHVSCGMGYSGFACRRYVYIFLHDGRVFDGIYASPRDFDPIAARGNISEGRWRLEGGDVHITWSAGSQKQEVIEGPITQGGSAPTDYRIAGRFSVSAARTFLTSTGVPNDNVSINHTYVFRTDGTFDESTSMGLTGASGVAANRTDAHGRYRIEGFTIEFAYSDGIRDNRIFSVLVTRGGQINAFVLGEHAFGREADASK